jgi:hypothetical protein
MNLNKIITDFLKQNDDLQGRYAGFIFQARVDFNGAVRVGLTYPANRPETNVNRSVRKELEKWLTRAAAFNKERLRLSRRESYPDLRKERKNLNPAEDPGDATPSYLDLAEELNRDIMGRLETAFSLEDDADPLWSLIARDDLEAAHKTMGFFNVPMRERETCINEARQRFSAGQPTFVLLNASRRAIRKPRLDGPIDKDSVRNKLRYLEITISELRKLWSK